MTCKQLTRCLLIITFLGLSGLSDHICSAKRVSEVVCSDGGSECSTITNSACDVPKLKCKCAVTYAEDRSDGSTCVLTLDNKPCTQPQGTECGANAKCGQTTHKCQCSAGFKMTVDTCVADNGGVTLTLSHAIFTIPAVFVIREVFQRI